MPRDLALSIVVPAYNEEGRLEAPLVATVDYCRARALAFEVIVVDDGSRDGTSDLVNQLSRRYPEIRLIRLAANRGKGYAVRTGVVNSRGQLVLFADADGATPISECARLEAAIAGGAGIAIGSRAIHGDGVRVQARFYRRVIGRSFHTLVRLLTVSGISDTQCGFKMFRADVAHDLFSRMRMNGFSFDVELLLMGQRQQYQIAEVAVNWEHQPGSRVSLVRDSLRMARDLFVIRAHLVRGHYDAPHLRPLSVAAPLEAPAGSLTSAP